MSESGQTRSFVGRRIDRLPPEADELERPGGPGHSGSGNVGLWGIASIGDSRVDHAVAALEP